MALDPRPRNKSDEEIDGRSWSDALWLKSGLQVSPPNIVKILLLPQPNDDYAMCSNS